MGIGTAHNVVIIGGSGGGSSNLQLGETDTTAYRGDRGKAAFDHTQDATIHVTTSQKTTWNNKLNAGANTGLQAANTRIGLIAPDGTITYSQNVYFDPVTRTLFIGSSTTPGKLDIASTIFKLKVQNNIASGNATLEINAGQDDGFSIVDSAGTKYIMLKSKPGEKGFIALVDFVFDQGIFFPLKQKQGALTSGGAGVKVYAKDSLGVEIEMPFGTDTMAGIFEAAFILKNSTASTTISGKFRATVRRVSGTIQVTQITDFITNAANAATIGVEGVGNNILKFYFTPNAADGTSYTGAITEIKYSVN